MRTRLRLFLDWGITFGAPYVMPERAARPVAYADRNELMDAIRTKYHPLRTDNPAALRGGAHGGTQPQDVPLGEDEQMTAVNEEEMQAHERSPYYTRKEDRT